MELEGLFRMGLYLLIAIASGAFLLGFTVFSGFALVRWFTKKQRLERVWAGLAGVVLNFIIFTFTFSRAYPNAKEFYQQVINRLF